MLAENIYRELDIDVRSEVPTIEVYDGIALDGQKEDDARVLGEGRDI